MFPALSTMALISTLIYSALVVAGASSRMFPPGFKFGAATSAYQVEGSLNISESIWHRYSHVPGNVADGGTGDLACDSLRRWRDDVRIARELGLHYYRFSISWPRLLPSGLADKVSSAGAQYYSQLIDALLENNIQPVVTLYHWDLPQRLQDLGGWTNPLISEWFADFARVVYSLYADRVSTWVTINEPTAFCDLTYNAGIHAPGILDPQFGNFLCIKHALVAHAKAWRIYDQEFRPKYHGKVSYTDVAIWVEPLTEQDEELARLANDYGTGLYTHAVYSEQGGWPPHIERKIAEYSRERGHPRSVLPPFTKDEIELVRGTFDFLGFNYYISRTARRAQPGEQVADCVLYGMPPLDAVIEARPEWETGQNQDWFTIYPEGLRKQLSWFKQQYGNIEYQIMEVGYPDSNPTLDDVRRIHYLRQHMEQVLLAIEDGVNVTALTVWSLLDNFEWADGYKTKFGLYSVDFASELRTRTPRASARYYAGVISTRSPAAAAAHSAGGQHAAKEEL